MIEDWAQRIFSGPIEFGGDSERYDTAVFVYDFLLDLIHPFPENRDAQRQQRDALFARLGPNYDGQTRGAATPLGKSVLRVVTYLKHAGMLDHCTRELSEFQPKSTNAPV